MGDITSRLGVLARRTGLYDIIEPRRSRRQRKQWEASGRPIPAPSSVKREVLRKYAQRHSLHTLIETGTYKADTVCALRHVFDTIHSVEIDPALHRAAVRRCRSQANAHIHLGDSAKVIATLVADLDEPGLFWLDAHYSGAGTGGEGDQPILDEVREAIEAEEAHVLLIDDVREFGTDVDYPQLQAVEDFAVAHGYTFEVRDDIARLVPVGA